MLLDYQFRASHVILIAQKSCVLISVLDDAYHVTRRVYTSHVFIVPIYSAEKERWKELQVTSCSKVTRASTTHCADWSACESKCATWKIYRENTECYSRSECPRRGSPSAPGRPVPSSGRRRCACSESLSKPDRICKKKPARDSVRCREGGSLAWYSLV